MNAGKIFNARQNIVHIGNIIFVKQWSGLLGFAFKKFKLSIAVFSVFV